MRLDRSDATSLTAIAVGGLMGLLGSGLLVERIDDLMDEDVGVEQLLEPEIRFDMPVVPRDGGMSIGTARRPAIYIDGVRVDADRMSLEDLDPMDIEQVEVIKGPNRLETGAISIRTKRR